MSVVISVPKVDSTTAITGLWNLSFDREPYKIVRPKFDSRAVDSVKQPAEPVLDDTSSQDVFDIHNYVENYNRRKSNIDTLRSFESLADNWNDYGAKSFPKALIRKCIDLIESPDLKYQPDIFPTGRDSIQFEYEDSDRYLEVEVYAERIAYYYESVNGRELSSEDSTWDEVLGLINEYNAPIQNR